MSDTPAPSFRPPAIVEWLYFLIAIFFFIWLFTYFWTSEGGPVLLAVTLIPITFILFTLEELRVGFLYPRLPPTANYAIAALYIGLSLAIAVYMHVEYMEIGTVRAGIWSPVDLAMGAVMVALIMEY
ncbi:MAG TPA: hypothetical protein VIG92_05460, partial [Rhodospirillales bacterium]